MHVCCHVVQALIGQHTFKLLPAAYQYKLIQLLPECDRVQVHDGQLRFRTFLFVMPMSQWLACWTQVLSGNSFRQTVHTHRASVQCSPSSEIG